jgi:hypothetical protein
LEILSILLHNTHIPQRNANGNLGNDMTQPSDYEFFFEADFPLSFDEVLGERQLCVAFDYEPEDKHDMIREGIWVEVFAKHDGDTEWENISHLVEPKEMKDFEEQCYAHLEQA